MRVFVVTGLELGWDCVVAVYDTATVSKEDLLKQYPQGEYVISEAAVETEIEDEFLAQPSLVRPKHQPDILPLAALAGDVVEGDEDE